MSEILKITIATSFQGQKTYTLLEECIKGAEKQYYVVLDDSQYIDYKRSHNPIRKKIIDKSVAEKFINDIKKLKIPIWPEWAMGLDGTTITVTIEQGFNSTSFKWWESLPKQWKPLRNIFKIFKEYSKLFKDENHYFS